MKVVDMAIRPTLDSINRLVKSKQIRQKDIISIFLNDEGLYVVFYWRKDI